ncbi:MAG: universal stress protein [Pseudomonadota bacterium]
MPDTDLQTDVSVTPRYRSLVTFVDSDPRSRKRLDAAMKIAQAQDAHLTVMALRYDANIPTYAFSDPMGLSIAENVSASRDEAEARANEARAALEAADVRGEAIPCVTLFRDVERDVASVARFADLAIVSPPYGDAVSGTASDILDGMLYDCDVPALVLPEEPASVDAKTVLVGWDGSRQALKAVKGALPLLQQAERVEVCIFDPKGDAPGQSLATMLARHDVAVEVAALPRPTGSVASALAQRAREVGAGLLVMGAYGHSRFRESIIGGVTRDSLEDVTVPLLLAH